MSKEVIIAGAVALLLTAATAAAFMIPRKPAEPVHTETDDITQTPPTPTPTDTDTHTDSSTAGSTTAFTGNGSSSGGFSATSPAIGPGGMTAATGSGTGIGPVAMNGPGPGGSGPGGGMGPAPMPHPFTAPEPIVRPQPPEEPPPADTGEGTSREHVVESGETLADISEKYYNTTRYWKKIVAANPGIDPNMLKVGQKLTIPVVSRSPASAPPSAAPVEGGYTVQAGDSYYRIAQRELGNASRWKEIEKLNPDIEPSELRVGQVIKLPPKQGGGEEGPAPADHGSGGDGVGGDHVHVVAQGETLSEISKQYYGTTSRWRDIVKANPGIDPESLKPGTKLTMPEAGAGAGSGASGHQAEDGPVAEGAEGTYVVQKGDTLKTIAAKKLGSAKAWKQLVDANPGIDPTRLRVGQKLKLSSKGGEPEAAPPPPAWMPAPAPAPAPAFPSGTSGGSATGSSGAFTGTTTGPAPQQGPAPSPPPFAPAPSAARSP